jgi:23S rRNA maturation-related 3'-5' exoribonuclease YhaM
MSDNHFLISGAKVGDTFKSIYYVISAYEKLAKNNNPYSDLTLCDKSGQAATRLWSNLGSIKAGQYIKVSAYVDEYQGKPQIILQEGEILNTLPEGYEVNFLRISETIESDIKKFDKYISKVNDYCKAIEDDTCSKILNAVFSPTVKKQFFESPANDKFSYGMKGGLLSQTVKVVYGVGVLASQYGFNNKELAIAITSSLLFNLGALKGVEYNGLMPVISKEGMFLGNKSSTLTLLERLVSKSDSLIEYKEEIIGRIYHAIASQNEYAVLPMTKEAILLREIINVDMRLTAAIDFISQDTNEGEFTAFDSNNKRNYFKG